MRNVAASLGLLATIAATPATAVELYASFGTGMSFTSADSGGINWFGPHLNTGEANDTVPPFTGALGVAFAPEEVGFAGLGLRLELAGAGNYATRFTTNSFAPPVPTFFYETEVDAWTGMVNLWVDVPLTGEFGLYVGGGAGFASVHLETDDTVVQGVETDINFAWTAGAGVSWRVAPWAVLDLGYRYVDLGDAATELVDPAPSVPPSYLTLDNMRSHQVLTSFRIQMPAGWIF
jgi:opacity protein-like surface antigen